jgi:hypothetical protein
MDDAGRKFRRQVKRGAASDREVAGAIEVADSY